MTTTLIVDTCRLCRTLLHDDRAAWVVDSATGVLEPRCADSCVNGDLVIVGVVDLLLTLTM